MSTNGSTTPKRILIVEDDLVLQWAYARMLAKMGYATACATTARDALRLLAGQSFDLILLDAHLPDAHGSTVVALLRSTPMPCGPDVPVLVVSSDDDPAHIKRMHSSGADRFLAKPVSFDELAVALERCLE